MVDLVLERKFVCKIYTIILFRSFTNYHPETWSSSWTISSMLIGVISFMHTNENTVGGVTSSE